MGILVEPTRRLVTAKGLVALVGAEMLGVKAGLGRYLAWAKPWSDCGRAFSITGLLIIVFFLLIRYASKYAHHGKPTWREEAACRYSMKRSTISLRRALRGTA